MLMILNKDEIAARYFYDLLMVIWALISHGEIYHKKSDLSIPNTINSLNLQFLKEGNERTNRFYVHH